MLELKTLGCQYLLKQFLLYAACLLKVASKLGLDQSDEMLSERRKTAGFVQHKIAILETRNVEKNIKYIKSTEVPIF